MQACSHKLRVNYTHTLSSVKYPYCIGACLNVTSYDSTTNDVSYEPLTPALSAEKYGWSGQSLTGMSVHVTEVRTGPDFQKWGPVRHKCGADVTMTSQAIIKTD